jgi:hypothetical protein
MALFRFIFASFGIFVNSMYIFTSFASYSLQNIRTDSHKNVQLSAKNTCCSKYSLQSKYLLKISHTGEYLLLNICSEVNRKTLSKFHIQANICLQMFTSKRIFASKYLHTSEYSLANICIPANIRYLLL